MLKRFLTLFDCCQKRSRTKAPSGKFHILLDIDRTLANAHTQELPQLMPWYQNMDHANLFIDAHYMHTLHPGVIELIAYLAAHPKIYASSLFGYCESIRNQPFAGILYKRALGDKPAKSHPAAIFNVENMTSFKYSDTEAQHIRYGFPNKTYYQPERKSITNLKEIDNPEQCILIDDNNYNIAPGEEMNFLLTCGADISDFVSIHHAQASTEPANDKLHLSLQRANHIFYIAGLLNRALQQSDPTQFLFSTQYEYMGLLQYRLRTELPYEMPELYHEGLIALQTINPNLKFHGGGLAQTYFAEKNPSPAMK